MFDVIKNIGAVIGGIATVVGLWKLYHSRLKIRAKGALSEQRLYPAANDAIRKFAEKLYYAESTERHDSSVKEKRVKPLLEIWPKDHFERFKAQVLTLPYLWTIEISNAGKAEGRDLILELPFEGFYVMDDENASHFKKRINIGTLRARGSIKIRIWTDDYSSGRDMHLTHSAGSIPVKRGHMIYGVSGAVLEFFQEYSGAFLVALLVIAAEIGLTLLTNKRDHNVPSNIIAPSSVISTTKPAAPASSESQ